MTLPYERTRAVLETEKFLRGLTNSKVTPGIPKALRLQAAGLLRHYPSESDLALTANGWNEKVVQWVSECPFSHPDDKGWQ